MADEIITGTVRCPRSAFAAREPLSVGHRCRLEYRDETGISHAGCMTVIDLTDDAVTLAADLERIQFRATPDGNVLAECFAPAK